MLNDNVSLEELERQILLERERCAKIAEGWLAAWAHKNPEHVSAQKWASDAVKDIADAIRSGALG